MLKESLNLMSSFLTGACNLFLFFVAFGNLQHFMFIFLLHLEKNENAKITLAAISHVPLKKLPTSLVPVSSY